MLLSTAPAPDAGAVSFKGIIALHNVHQEKLMSEFGITLSDIYAARKRVAAVAVRTPLMPSRVLGKRVGASVYLKLENVQHTGSFKLRGATNKMLSLTDSERERGVITVSSGNHGRAVSYVASALGINATVCLAETVPANKIEGIRRYGAEIVSHGQSYNEADAHAARLQAEQGLTFVDPFDQPETIAGQGTIGLEILEDLPEVDTVVVPLSGGGLISGIALAMKSANPAIRVIGVSMERGPVMYACLQAGKLVDLPEEPTLADALVGGFGGRNNYTFRMCQALLDETMLVSEEEIAEAMAFMLEAHHLVVEGGGAVGIAALRSGRLKVGEHVAVVVSGGNVDIPLLCEIASRHR
jgi:threonine dehydratase